MSRSPEQSTVPADAQSAGEPFTLLVTFGTDHHRFARLSLWLERWLATHRDVRCIVQEGYSPAPAGAETIGMVSREELLSLMRAASAVVGQGGPGTILDAAVCGKLPIVVPRLSRHGEVVDDHQVAFCRRMAADGRALLAESPEMLHAHLDMALRDPRTVVNEAGAPSIDATAANVRELLGRVVARDPAFLSLRRMADLLGPSRARRASRTVSTTLSQRGQG